MLSIHSTEQLTGARISGDFWDIDELINAIYKITGDDEYVMLKSQLMEAAGTTKKSLHEIEIKAKYPETILW
jgi:hypothetical protein